MLDKTLIRHGLALVAAELRAGSPRRVAQPAWPGPGAAVSLLHGQRQQQHPDLDRQHDTPRQGIRVRFAEGENGRDAYSLNVYLGGRSTWTAAIGPTIDQLPSNDGGTLVATLVSSAKSCTVPSIPATGVQFSNAAFSGANADPGDAGLARTMEGTIEVIEMGTVIDYSPTEQAFYADQGCASLANAWSPGGYWANDPKTDLLNPTGGCMALVTSSMSNRARSSTTLQ